MPGAPVHFLEQAQAQHPNIAADLAEFAELYEKKLWHELTVKLTDVLGKPEFHQGEFLVQLYRRAMLPPGPQQLYRLRHNLPMPWTLPQMSSQQTTEGMLCNMAKASTTQQPALRFFWPVGSAAAI